MTELDAINVMLMQGAGSDPINQLNSANDEAAKARKILNVSRKRTLARGWPFNTDYYTLTANTSGEIEMPAGFLSVALPSRYAIRGRDGKKYVWDRHNRTFTIGRTFTGAHVVRDLDFVDLPEEVAQLITYVAAEKFAISMSASAERIALMRDERDRSEVEVSIEYPVILGNNEYVYAEDEDDILG